MFNKRGEHIIPYAFGNIGETLYRLYCVCGDCNSKLGKYIDEPFTRASDVMDIRKSKNMSGRSSIGSSESFEFNAVKTEAYSNAVIKFAYETAILWFGYDYCSDETANEIRKTLHDYMSAKISTMLDAKQKYFRYSGIGDNYQTLNTVVSTISKSIESLYIHYVWATSMNGQTWLSFNMTGLPQASVCVSTKDRIKGLPQKNLGVFVFSNENGAISWIHPQMVELMPTSYRSSYEKQST